MGRRASLIFAAIASTLPIAATAGPIRAGAAKVDVTPPATDFPYVVPREKPYLGVHDPLYARAIAIDDGRRRALIITLDTTSINEPEAMVRAVAAASGAPATAVLLVATHTHSTPLTFLHGEITNPVQPREIAQLRDGAVAAAKAALAALAPARIAWARGQAYVNTNNGEESGRKGWYDPKAASDKALDVLRISGIDGRPIAVLLNYATHGEVMFRSVTSDGGYLVTGDLPGAVSRILETQPGGAPVALYTPGAEGDQLPLFKSLQPDAELQGSDAGAAGWALLDAQARRLASAAIEVIASMPPGTADAAIMTDAGSVTCPGQKYDVERPSGRILGVHDTGPVTIPLQTLKIGDVALAGVGADISSAIGSAIKARSPVRDTTVVTMIAGSIGYVLNDAAFVHPSHGALGSPVKPGCAPTALPGGIAKLLASR